MWSYRVFSNNCVFFQEFSKFLNALYVHILWNRYHTGCLITFSQSAAITYISWTGKEYGDTLYMHVQYMYVLMLSAIGNEFYLCNCSIDIYRHKILFNLCLYQRYCIINTMSLEMSLVEDHRHIVSFVSKNIQWDGNWNYFI